MRDDGVSYGDYLERCSTNIKDDTVIKKKNEGVNEGVNEGANEGAINEVSDIVKQGLFKLVEYIYINEGTRANVIAEKINISEATLERYINILKKIKFIEYRGAPKTGGYYLTNIAKNKIHINL